MMTKYRELVGLESDPTLERPQNSAIRPEQIEDIFSLSRLVIEHNDGTDPRSQDYLWLDKLMFDVSGLNEGRLRILSEPEKANDQATNWIPTSLLASRQLLMYEGGETVVQGYAGIRSELSESGAENVIGYIQSRLEIMGAFNEAELEFEEAVGAIAVEEVVA